MKDFSTTLACLAFVASFIASWFIIKVLMCAMFNLTPAEFANCAACVFCFITSFVIALILSIDTERHFTNHPDNTIKGE